MHETGDAGSGLPRTPSLQRWGTVIAFAVLALLAIVMPLAYRGVVAAPSHKGFIACIVGRSTLVPISYYDYGKWLWFDASGPITGVLCDNPNLVVTSFSVDPSAMRRSLNRQRLLLKLDILALTPGIHPLTSITLLRGARTTTIPIGSLVFDARAEEEGSLALVDMRGCFEWCWLPQTSTEFYFQVIAQSNEPVKIRVLTEGLPEGVAVTAPVVDIDPHGQALMQVVLSDTPGMAAAEHSVLVRPWLAVSRPSGQVSLQPGPLLAMESTDGS